MGLERQNPILFELDNQVLHSLIILIYIFNCPCFLWILFLKEGLTK